ncbi:MAG: hypothetical protein H0U53_10380 [Actinobacteria bacterium]|nr:hypothetical protein [Actinomycetota bacterium]
MSKALISPVAVTALLMLTACTPEATDRAGSTQENPSPATSRDDERDDEGGLCQPFPDRLIDDFLTAYNSRDLQALEELVVAPQIEDLVAAAYTGRAVFDDIDDWASAVWDANDRLHNSGYNAFHPSKNGFQMLVTRKSDSLRAAGINRVSTTLNVDTDGCSITSLESAGPVQAAKSPCRFYSEFADIPDVADAAPRDCADGSGTFARSHPVLAVVDGRALIWGGDRGGHFTFGDVAMDGLLLDPKTPRSSLIGQPPGLPPFRAATGVWTGEKLFVIGNTTRPDYHVVAAAYDLRMDRWDKIAFPYKNWSGFEGVWTGREVVLWGGPDHSSHPYKRGVAYDPSTGRWRRTSPAPVAGRWSHSVVWTGMEMIVWGGSNANSDLGDGAAYDPVTDTWREIAQSPLSSRQWLPLAWTGNEVVVWGGSSVSKSRANGAAYDPTTDSWRELPPSPLKGRHYHSATWTGTEVIIFGGYNYRRPFADGAAYDPLRDRWRRLPAAPIRPRFLHAATSIGGDLFVFGGTSQFGHIALGDGATYDSGSRRWRRVIPNP